ncbi:hypothetical protein ABBQ38_005906 [Trebouxia sp. C0009 RCD-2024]
MIWVFAAVGFCGICLCTDATRNLLQTTSATDTAVEEYVWRITVGSRAPDCFQRDVILVNGTFQPTLVTVVNDMPADYPSVADGISIHWHGFSMRGSEWYDGTGRITQCPIAPGTNFTYKFQVNEQPGSYFWHDHSASNRADGLQGALIVLPSVPQLPQYDAEETLFITDWFHGNFTVFLMTTNQQNIQLAHQLVQGFTLNRPFAKGSQSPQTGQWQWVGLPQANLINGKGFYGDCALIGGLGNVAGVATVDPTCNVTTGIIAAGKSKQQPWATPSNPGCTHENISVVPGQTYRFRIINGGSLLYQTVCFEGHNVTVIAADATPTEPISFGPCVDVNSGQRYDVLLTANASVGNYWITVQPQYRLGSPNGFGVLRYEGAAPTLPQGPVSQPGAVKPWSILQIDEVVTAAYLVQPNQSSSSNDAAIAEVIGSAAPVNHTSLQVPLTSNRTFIEVITQPLLNQTGQLRWALNNRANTETPSCDAKLSLVHANNAYYDDLAATSQAQAGQLFNQTVDSASEPVVLLDSSGTVLELPSAGQHVISISLGEVIDVVVVNKPANSYNGDLTQATSLSP